METSFVTEREGANEKLRDEIMLLVGWCQELDMGRLPEGFQDFIKQPIVDGWEESDKLLMIMKKYL